MSTKLKDIQITAPPVEPPAKEPARFSPTFLSAMSDYAYNTLHDYLVAQGIDPEAIELLSSLVVIQQIQMIYLQEKEAIFIWNEEASYCIGRISFAVPKLGGHFMTPSGALIEA